MRTQAVSTLGYTLLLLAAFATGLLGTLTALSRTLPREHRIVVRVPVSVPAEIKTVVAVEC